MTCGEHCEVSRIVLDGLVAYDRGVHWLSINPQRGQLGDPADGGR